VDVVNLLGIHHINCGLKSAMYSSKILSVLGQTCFVSLCIGFGNVVLLAPSAQAVTISSLEYLGQATFPTGSVTVNGAQGNSTQVGGLSGVTYDANTNSYYSISDDRSQINPARFYTLSIDLSQGTLSNNNVSFTGVTTLLNAQGQPFPAFSLDPESIELTNRGTVFISSEGDTNRLINPFVNEFSLTGQQVSSLPIPQKFLPTINPVNGIRNNLAFESLALTPDQNFLVTATENALAQDGPAASVSTGSPSRILKYDLTTRQPVGEFLYNTDSVALPPVPADQFSTNGLVDLRALDNTGNHFLALERSFSTGAVGTAGNTGNTIKLYEISLDGATDISGIDSLIATGTNGIVAAQKNLLLDFTSLGIPLDNVEGLTFGPTLPNGDRSLVLVSDNNFSATQFTQVLAFDVKSQSTTAIPTPSLFAGLVIFAVKSFSKKKQEV
jgi:hypothetical protein